MDELQRQVRRAQRRLAWQRLVETIGWCWFVSLIGALLLIAADKFHPLGVAAWIWILGALAVGLLAAVAWTLASWRKPLDAAIEIDRRFNLKERVSSTLAMPAEALDSEAGRALVEDAARRVGRIDLAAKFAVVPPRQILLPVVPGVAALLVAILIGPASVDNAASANSTVAAEQKQQVKKTTEVLSHKLAERRQQAEKEGLKDATQLLKKLEEGSKELVNEPQREKAMVKLNDLSRQLQQRRNELGGAEKIKQQLQQLKKIDQGPADKLAQALSHGDFKKAAEELQKLKKQVADKQLDDRQKEEIAKQLQQVEQKLKEMADAAQTAQDDLKKQIDQLKRDGQMAEANKLEEQLHKLLEQVPQMQRMQDLAKKLGQCKKCMGKGGNAKDAAQALNQLGDQLDQLQKDMDELQTLDGAMEQLADAKEKMACPGCGQAGGQGDKLGDIPGDGLGGGRGIGARPEKKTDTSMYDSQVRQKIGAGAATVTDLVPGPNIKGRVEAELQQQFDTARRGNTDPLSGSHIPRKHSEQAREYFDHFREGK
jgi:hypothetical protein